MIREVIKTDGTSLSLDFGLGGMKLFCDAKKVEFFDLLELFNRIPMPSKQDGENGEPTEQTMKMSVSFFEDIALLTVCAGKNAARKQGKEWTHTTDEVLDWISDGEVNMFDLLGAVIATLPKPPAANPQTPGMKSGE